MDPRRDLGELRLNGWKGFQGAKVRLWPVTFLVGPNGSGKSSVLEALALVSHLARRSSLPEESESWLRGWPDGIFSREEGGEPVAQVSIELTLRDNGYRVVLQNPARPEIWEERLWVRKKDYIITEAKNGHRVRKFMGEGVGKPLVTDDPYESALGLFSRSPPRRIGARKIIDLITGIEVYALDADHLRGTSFQSQSQPYFRKGMNLVMGLLDAKRDSKVWTRVFAALKGVQPDLKEVKVREQKPRGVVLIYQDGRELELGEESDGLVRAAGMFLARYRPLCPSILAYDEPENGFHLSRVVEVVSRLSPDRKGNTRPRVVVLATHSVPFVKEARTLLGKRMGVLSLWRGLDGRVSVTSWPGEDLQDNDKFKEMVATAFEGR